MHRRELLAVVGASTALAGCGAPRMDPRTPTPSTRPSERLRFSASVTGTFDEEGPATIELRVANDGERGVVATGTLGPVLPFAGRFGLTLDGRRRLLCQPDRADDYWFRIDSNDLVPAADVIPTAPVDGCWRIPPAFDGIADVPAPISREVMPDAELEHAYALYHVHDCAPGTYTFAASVTLSDVEEHDGDDGSGGDGSGGDGSGGDGSGDDGDGASDGDAGGGVGDEENGSDGSEPEERVPLRLRVTVAERDVTIDRFGYVDGFLG